MTKNNTYRVVSDTLNLVLFVKGFTLEKEQELYNQIRKRIQSADAPISITTYKDFIVRKFLLDFDAFCEQAEKEGEDFEDAVDAAYESIIGIYPPFSLEFICQDLNTDTFFSGVKGKFLNHLKEQIKAHHGEAPPIGLSSIEDINHVESFFKDNIVGQRDAIESLVKALKLMASGLSKHSSFLFVGPTGVGKTQLAKLLGDRYSNNFYKINCAEYAGGHEYAKLIGSPPGYVGHTEKSLLAEKAEESNQWVFLFDEIEKAHHKLYDFLLSLLDDGTCTDNMGTVLDFSESIFIFTSNQGISDIKRNPVGFDRKLDVEEKVTDEVIRNSIKKHFSPEFLNRLDEIVKFNSLTKDEVREIAELQLEEIPIIKTKPLVDFVVEGGYSQEYGARNIARFIKNHVTIHIADAILNKRVPKDPDVYYRPRVSNGEIKLIGTKKYETSSL